MKSKLEYKKQCQKWKDTIESTKLKSTTKEPKKLSILGTHLSDTEYKHKMGVQAYTDTRKTGNQCTQEKASAGTLKQTKWWQFNYLSHTLNKLDTQRH